MKKLIWTNKLLAINIALLVIVKLAFAYPAHYMVGVITGTPAFSGKDVIEQTNEFRNGLGLSPLNENSLLDAIASQKLKDMATEEYFAHFSPSGISPWHWFEINDYSYLRAGENLAIGFFSAEDTVNAWAKSESHRANMENIHYTEIGVAVSETEINGTRGTLVVQLFGTPSPIPVVQASPVPITASPIPTSSIVPQITSTPSPTKEPAIVPIVATQGDLTINPIITSVAPKINSTMQKLNYALISYSILITMLSLIYLIPMISRRKYISRIALHVAFSALVILLPPIEIARIAMIL